jgi:glycine hydroxymethyltransferase
MENTNKSLKEADNEIYELIQKEAYRQFAGLELIASENYTSQAVLETLGSCLTNKYSEGNIGARYYGGNQYIDEIEKICCDRALAAFRLDKEKWGVNVQPYSGSPANLEAFMAILNPGDKIMGLDLPSGGHLTHGYQTENKKISATSVIFESKPYKTNQETGLLDYEDIKKTVVDFKPKLLIVGHSAYPRDLDYKQFREIADAVGAYMLVDMAHISGLIAAEEQNNPFEYADIVTTTTHKSLRGPRSGMIFFKTEFKSKIDFAVFPMLQGGPHNHQIAALAVQLKEVNTPEFKEYIRQVKKNAVALSDSLVKRGHKLVTGGTENHLVLIDVRPFGLTGNKVEKACELAHITLNKNAIIGDKSALSPGGIRVGTPAVTTRGMKEEEMDLIAEFIDRSIKLCIDIQSKSGKKIDEFVNALKSNEEIIKLGGEVEEFSKKFFIPAIDISKFDN